MFLAESVSRVIGGEEADNFWRQEDSHEVQEELRFIARITRLCLFLAVNLKTASCRRRARDCNEASENDCSCDCGEHLSYACTVSRGHGASYD